MEGDCACSKRGFFFSLWGRSGHLCCSVYGMPPLETFVPSLMQHHPSWHQPATLWQVAYSGFVSSLKDQWVSLTETLYCLSTMLWVFSLMEMDSMHWIEPVIHLWCSSPLSQNTGMWEPRCGSERASFTLNPHSSRAKLIFLSSCMWAPLVKRS